MDRRKKLSPEQLEEIKAYIAKKMKHETIARQFNISTTHVSRIKSAMDRGEVKLKRSSLTSCLGHIKDGLPFRRESWPEGLYYYCAIDEPNKWFVRVYERRESELVTYSLDLELEDLLAKDWVVLTWESVK